MMYCILFASSVYAPIEPLFFRNTQLLLLLFAASATIVYATEVVIAEHDDGSLLAKPSNGSCSFEF